MDSSKHGAWPTALFETGSCYDWRASEDGGEGETLGWRLALSAHLQAPADRETPWDQLAFP